MKIITPLLIALLALAPLCPADEATLQQQLNTYAHNSRTQAPPAPEVMEKGRAIWEGKQRATLDDMAAFSIYARAALSMWRPEYLVSPDQNVILCYTSTLLEGDDGPLLHRFGIFHREGDRFVCKNRYDFYSQAFCDMRKIVFERDGVVLHFLLQQYDDTPKVTASLKIRFDTPWDKSYLLSSSREAERLSDKLSWRFVHAVEQMDTATIDEFIRHGYTLDKTMPDQLREDHGDECLFFRALRWCSDEELARALPYLLQHYEQDLNAQDKNGNSPALFKALSYEGKPRTIKMLLDAGANPNQTDSNNQTPLMIAACRLCPLSVKHLLDAGADVHARDHYGYTPMHWSLRQQWPMKDAQGNWVQNTKDLCASVLDTARILIAAGADINACDAQGQPPIFLLCKSHADALDECLLILLPELVKLGADLTIKDTTGNTFADLLPARCIKTRQLIDTLLSEQQKPN